MNIKFIAIDMDGTILRDNNTVSSETIKTVKKIMNNGVQIILCTGRPLSHCKPFADKLQLNSYLIVANGAEIWLENKLLKRNTIPEKLIKIIWKYGVENELDMLVSSTEHLFINNLRFNDFDNNKQWLKMVFNNLDKEKKKATLLYLKRFLNLEISSSSPNNLEINLKDVNKLKALEFITEKNNISIDQVMAIGDSFNDYLMLKNCGIGIAMGNGEREVKEIADYITLTNENDGVAYAIQKFLNLS